MSNNLSTYFQNELKALDAASASKRHERIITELKSPTQAIIDGRQITLFNTNDYLGLRLEPALINAEQAAVDRFGVGAGSVRFISGTNTAYKDLERQVASFHQRDDAILFSSAFMANLATMSVLAKDRSAGDCLLLTDEMNHRSIIDGIRLANKAKEDKRIYPHLDYDALAEALKSGRGRYQRAMIVTDGVFSMLGDYADLKRLVALQREYESQYPDGVLLVVDDCHGVGVTGDDGRGTEAVFGQKVDVLIGTFGKAMGTDGGYVVADQPTIDFLREKGASYIFSNSFSPGSAGAASQAVDLLGSPKGEQLRRNLRANVELFQRLTQENGLVVASHLAHPIQPLVIGESGQTLRLANLLFDRHGFFVTPITFPAVAKGKEELRIQINATHTEANISGLVQALAESR